ncbi:hypothetical protein [Nostoc sp.]|uniref:hypothetical protein n=1 Tax=Nostoc sp. TaxID=1180 RepID=UPI002FFBE2E5
MNECLNSINESLILVDESLNFINESLILVDESLNSINESLILVNKYKTLIFFVPLPNAQCPIQNSTITGVWSLG